MHVVFGAAGALGAEIVQDLAQQKNILCTYNYPCSQSTP